MELHPKASPLQVKLKRLSSECQSTLQRNSVGPPPLHPHLFLPGFLTVRSAALPCLGSSTLPPSLPFGTGPQHFPWPMGQYYWEGPQEAPSHFGGECWVGYGSVGPCPPPFMTWGQQPQLQDHQVGRFGKTTGWMVRCPAGVRPPGTDSWVLAAQLKPTSRPPRTGTWGQTLSGLALPSQGWLLHPGPGPFSSQNREDRPAQCQPCLTTTVARRRPQAGR